MRARTWVILTTGVAIVGGGWGCQSQRRGRAANDAFASRGSIDASTLAQRDPRALPCFDGRTGEPLTWADIMRRAADADVVILGEQHDDALAHAVQLAFAQDAGERRPQHGALSMEMLERDEQNLVDDYLDAIIDAPTLAKLTFSETWAGEGSWTNWYQPVIDAAAMHGWDVVAANAPRRYVRLARSEGFDRLAALPEPRRSLFALPLTNPVAYYRRFEEVMAHGHSTTQPTTAPQTQPAFDATTTSAPSNNSMFAEDGVAIDTTKDAGFRSQLLWDATMADSIARARRAGARPVVHLIGQFHCDFAGGTVQELLARVPGARVLVISMQRGDGAALRDDDRDRADVVIYTRPPEPDSP